ncbi:hypothetical protein [Bradyrhizobium lupini]
MAKLYWICAAVLGCLMSPVQAAGVQLLDTDPNLAGAIWYPCAAAAQRVPLGKLTVQFIETIEGTKDCPVTGTNLPLVIVSHGRGGWFGQHDDTVQALATLDLSSPRSTFRVTMETIPRNETAFPFWQPGPPALSDCLISS